MCKREKKLLLLDSRDLGFKKRKTVTSEYKYITTRRDKDRKDLCILKTIQRIFVPSAGKGQSIVKVIEIVHVLYCLYYSNGVSNRLNMKALKCVVSIFTHFKIYRKEKNKINSHNNMPF